jgi:hypothetical protein
MEDPKVEMTISCRKLPSKDLLSKCDPVVLVYVKNGRAGTWNLAGQTETQVDQADPDFRTKILVDFKYEIIQDVKFEVCCEDVILFQFKQFL